MQPVAASPQPLARRASARTSAATVSTRKKTAGWYFSTKKQKSPTGIVVI